MSVVGSETGMDARRVDADSSGAREGTARLSERPLRGVELRISEQPVSATQRQTGDAPVCARGSWVATLAAWVLTVAIVESGTRSQSVRRGRWQVTVR